MVDTGLRSDACRQLAEALQWSDVKSLNVLKNPLDDEGLKALVAAATMGGIGSICGVAEGDTETDWAKWGLSAMDCSIIAADFGLRHSNTLERIVLRGNDAFGRLDGHRHIGELVAAATSRLVEGRRESSRVTDIDLSKCGLSSDAIATLVASVPWAESAIDKITVRQ